MMKILIALFLSLLLLSGCSASQTLPPETIQPTAAVATETAATEPVVPLPEQPGSGGAIQIYNLEQELSGILPLKDKLVLFTGTDSTTLSLIDPKTMLTEQTYTSTVILTPENFTVQLLNTGLSYFDSHTRQTAVLNDALQEVRRIDAPENLAGAPLLSRDGKTLFYCTADAIRALDISSGISRILKEASYPVQGLSGLLMDDTILQVSITDDGGQWQTLFLSTETGQLLHTANDMVNPVTSDRNYFVSLNEGALQTCIFGMPNGDTMLFHPLYPDSSFSFLPDCNQVVTMYPEDSTVHLDLYDLNTCRRISSLSIADLLPAGKAVQDAQGGIWFMGHQTKTEQAVLCRWNEEISAVSDSTAYGSIRYSQENPDYDGLAACSLYAQEISNRYGIEILIYKDAVQLEPWDYHLEYEYHVPVLRRELEALDQRLGAFPQSMLKKLSETFTSLKICLVGSAVGSPESGSLEAVNGIQFLDNYDAYIILATDHDTQYALYHELCHLFDTIVLTQSTAYDRWHVLNPEGFDYDNDYIANQSRDGSQWLEPGKEYFIDTYSMSWAKEDRARIMEYAMTPGHEQLFQSPRLQAKLRQLCIGIREAFDLEQATENFLWEQYLQESIHP